MDTTAGPASRLHPIAKLGLRKLVYISTALVIVLAAGVCGSLMTLTTRMHDQAIRVRQSMASVRAAQSVEIHLFQFSRAVARLKATQNPQFAKLSNEEEKAIVAGLTHVQSFANAPQERQRVTEASDKTLNFVKLRKTLERSNSLREAMEKSSPALDAALFSLDELVAANIERSNRAISLSARTDQLANQIAITLFTLLLATLALITYLSVRFVYRPLVLIHSAILAFSKGSKTARSPETGLAELRLIASQLNELADQTADFDQKRLYFLTGTAHDLRNPLTAMKTTVALFKSHFDQLTAEQKTHSLELLERQVVKLENMTSSFLDAIRIESGAFTLNVSHVDITAILRDVLDLWDTTDGKHQLSFTSPSAPIYLDGDPLRLEQIFTNLISNAIKYTPAGGKIDVKLQSSPDGVAISVTDHGIGIPSDEIDRIFDPFHRTLPAQHLMPGVGIGLWVTKRLVEAHHGTVEVSSTLGSGSSFTIHFPAQAAGMKVA